MSIRELGDSVKKPRRANPVDTSHSTTTPSSDGHPMANGKPGKKRLRKMKHQQQELSPEDVCILIAKNAAFTNSVLLGVDDCPTPETTRDDDMDESPNRKSIRKILTLGQLPSQAAPDMIYVQPLLVLDLNGILCHRLRFEKGANIRKTAYRPSIAAVAQTPVIPRTDIHEFLSFLDSHFCLGVWTSAKNKTAKALVKALFPPPVASRLLFVWAQHHCDVVVDEHSSSDIPDTGKSKPQFEKDLSKVWKEFPLWNNDNTLLMDDSPGKCVKWHENAIHPPPLNGYTHEAIGNKSELFLYDGENERLQSLFFRKLVEFWKSHTLERISDGTKTTMDLLYDGQPLKSNRNSNFMVQFLKENAVGHMGWK